ncbi:transglutaminase family protein [Sphingomonas oryzagri]
MAPNQVAARMWSDRRSFEPRSTRRKGAPIVGGAASFSWRRRFSVCRSSANRTSRIPCCANSPGRSTSSVGRYDRPPRRRGLPRARCRNCCRCDGAADALNTPGHVVVSLAAGEIPAIIDPFSGGRLLNPGGLLALIAHATGRTGFPDELHLSAMTNRMTLTRLLLNQASRAGQAGDSGRAMTLYERMTVVAPGEGKGWWELARLRLEAGKHAQARESLTAMLEITKDAEQRAHVIAMLEAIG